MTHAAVRGLARIAALCLLLAPAAAQARHVDWIQVSGTINPASSDFIQKSIAQSATDGAEALVLELDTPGGLVSATKDIIQAMLNAEVPVVVYVAPQGAWAGSAGTFITLAGHVAAMAPGTSIGAAHPVGVGGPVGEGDKKGEGRDIAGEKAENLLAAFIESIARERGRNVEWAVKAVRNSEAIPSDQALKLHVIDLIANDRIDLLQRIDGRKVKVQGNERTLSVAGAELKRIEMTPLERLLHVLASPDLAVVLLMAGALGLYIEVTQPGMVLPGVLGVGCLILAAIALQILPFSWLGLILFLAGFGLLTAELFVGSYGLLFALGIGCVLIGGKMIFDLPDVSDLRVSFWSVLVPAVAGMAAFLGIAILAIGRTARRGQTVGVADLIGQVGRADSAIAPEGSVFVRGEFWTARADEPVAAGERVEVLAVEGMLLRVRKAPAAERRG